MIVPETLPISNARIPCAPGPVQAPYQIYISLALSSAHSIWHKVQDVFAERGGRCHGDPLLQAGRPPSGSISPQQPKWPVLSVCSLQGLWGAELTV